MAKYVVTAPNVTLNGTALTSNIAEATLTLSAAEVDVTNAGSNGYREVTGGLKSGELSLTLHRDTAAGSVDATIVPLIGSLATAVVKPNGGTTSATNNAFTAVVLVTGYTPVAGAIGDLAVATITWPVSGGWTIGTAAV
jgi:hypothetical protein